MLLSLVSLHSKSPCNLIAWLYRNRETALPFHNRVSLYIWFPSLTDTETLPVVYFRSSMAHTELPGGFPDTSASAAASDATVSEARGLLERLVTILQPMLALDAVLRSDPKLPKSTLPPGTKPPPVDKLSAKKKSEIVPWITRTRSILRLSGIDLNSPDAVRYISTFLTDHARAWFEMRTTERNDDTAGFSTFDDFAASLEHDLGDAFSEQRARQRIISIQQTRSVSAYGTEYQRLASQLPHMHFTDLRFFYLKGLKPRILELITGRYTDLDAWTDIHKIAMEFDEINRGNRIVSPSNPWPHGPTPMDLGNINTSTYNNTHHRSRSHPTKPGSSSPKYPPLTPEERARLEANNGCVYCRQLGHQVQDCPKKRNHEARSRSHSKPYPSKN